MTILEVMPQYPWPMTDGGKVGLGNIAMHYARLGHDVHVLCYHSGTSERQDPPDLTVHTVPYAPTNTLWRIARSVFRRRALYMWKHDTLAMHQALDRIIVEHKVQVLHCDHTCMAPLVAEAARRHGLVWGLRLHNIEWMIWQRYAERFPTWHPARWYLRLQARKLRREEAEMIAQADSVFAITPVDRDRALQLAPGARAVVAPAGIDPEMWDLPRTTHRPPQIIMAANYHWVHNADGLRWFLDHVWPEVMQRTEATLHIVGSRIPEWLNTYTGERLINEGFAESLPARYQQASISVAPLFVGSGMRLKIIEAMAAGLPVIATSISAEGIELFEGDGLFRYDTAETMANGLIRLVQDAELCDRLGQAAQRSVQRTYTWDATVRCMVDELESRRREQE